MAFSYDPNLATQIDQLRFLVQDTAESLHFLEDEEINFTASTETNLNRAAAVLCRTIAAKINKFPGYKDKQIFEPEKKAEIYRKLAEDFDKKAESGAGLNISASSIEANFNNSCSETTSPAFTRKLHLESET